MNKMTPSRRRAEAKTLSVMAFFPFWRIVSLASNLIVPTLPFRKLTGNQAVNSVSGRYLSIKVSRPVSLLPLGFL